MRILETLIAVSLLAISTEANACNQESFEPDDYLRADLLVVGTIKNYRIVPDITRGEALRKVIADGSATQWQRDRYYADLAAGKPPGGVYALFDIEVEGVVKGKVAKTVSAVFFDITMLHQGTNSPSLLPRQMGPKKMFIGLRLPTERSDPRLPRVIANDCIGVMMHEANEDTAINMRRHLRQYQEFLRKRQVKINTLPK